MGDKSWDLSLADWVPRDRGEGGGNVYCTVSSIA